MKILITNLALIGYTGTETYIHDLAIELKERGHTVGVYTSFLKSRSAELLDRGIEVVSSLKKLSFLPDIVHGHHHVETISALNYFKETPAIFISHSPYHPLDRPPKMEQIIRFFGVDNWCRKRVANNLGVSEEKVGFLNNFVNTKRFKRRATPLPETPQKALVFSNYASGKNFLPILQEACRKKNIYLDVMGSRSKGICTNPEKVLEKYDIVFCKTKAAIEALATGNCVILCDYAGFGGMVTTENFHEYRENNFGWNILTPPILECKVIEEIEKYNPLECQKTCDLIREMSSLDIFTDKVVDLYVEVIEEYSKNKVHSPHKISTYCKLLRMKYIIGMRYPTFERSYKVLRNFTKNRLLKKRSRHGWIDL